MTTSIVENYQKSNKLPIKNMFFGKKKEIKNEPEDTSSKDLAIVTQMNQEFAKSLDLKETLQNSLEVINPINEKFDPNLHQAIKTIENDKKDDNTVEEVLQKGYKLVGRVIKPALVVVIKNKLT